MVKSVFYRVRRMGGRYYLIKEWYDPETKKRSVSLGPATRSRGS